MQELENYQLESLGFYVGLDLGQSQDYTAIIVVEALRYVPRGTNVIRDPSQVDLSGPNERAKPASDPFYHARYIARVPLGTSYVEIVRHVKEDIIARIRPQHNIHLIVDSSGVGAGIVDMISDAGLNPIRVMVHGGSSTNNSKGVWHVPKRDLVGAAKALLSKGELKFVSGEHTDILVQELHDFTVRITASGHDTYEAAWREGAHDDLVFALSMACWYATKKQKRGGRLLPIVELEKGIGNAYDPARASMLRDADKGGRFSGLTGFRDGGFNPP